MRYKITNVREVAKFVRESLKEEFPTKKGWKFGVRSDSFRGGQTLTVTIKKSPVHFVSKENESIRPVFGINHYHLELYQNSEVLAKIVSIMQYYNWNNSDSQKDYFDVNYYINLNVGTYEQPCVYTD